MSQKKLSLATCTALVTGNIIGTGIFVIPASLAMFGSIGLIAWAFTGIGAILLALVFANMSRYVKQSGGPYAFAQAGFGEFIGFQTAYSYWIAMWVGSAATALAVIGYLQLFIPLLHAPLLATTAAIALIWFLTGLNFLGVQVVGIVQLTTTVIKLLPILAVGLFGWTYFHPHYLVMDYNLTHNSTWPVISHAAAITLWTFTGIESATIPRGDVENPDRTIPLATIFGTIIVCIVYGLSSLAIMGMIPPHILKNSATPFADAAEIIFGPTGAHIIGIAAIISGFGSLNGWIMIQAKFTQSAAERGHFHRIFGLINRHDIPYASLMINATLMSTVLLFTMSARFVQQYNTIILLSTLSYLMPYLFTSLTNAKLISLSKNEHYAKTGMTVAILAAIYAFWTIIGSGTEVVFYGMILLLTAYPIYAIHHRPEV